MDLRYVPWKNSCFSKHHLYISTILILFFLFWVIINNDSGLEIFDLRVHRSSSRGENQSMDLYTQVFLLKKYN